MSAGYLQTVLYLLNRSEPIRQTALLMVLAAGVGDSEGLVERLRAHADESGEPWSGRVHGLCNRLQSGLPLSTALHSDPGLLRDSTVCAIRVGEETGSLADVMLDEAGQMTQRSDASDLGRPDPLSTLVWLISVLTVGGTLISFIMFFIIPKFKKIFEDFGSELPPVTVRLITVADFCMTYFPFVGLPLVALLLSVACVTWNEVARNAASGRSRLANIRPRQHAPELLRLLSISVASGHDTGKTIHTFQCELPPGRISKLFSRLRQQLMGGEDLVSVLVNGRVLTQREGSFLDAACRNGHLDWGLRQLGIAIQRRHERFIGLLVRMAEPLLILCAGLVVMFVVVGLMMPVIQLLNRESSP